MDMDGKLFKMGKYTQVNSSSVSEFCSLVADDGKVSQYCAREMGWMLAPHSVFNELRTSWRGTCRPATISNPLWTPFQETTTTHQATIDYFLASDATSKSAGSHPKDRTAESKSLSATSKVFTASFAIRALLFLEKSKEAALLFCACRIVLA
jgi:hypothetical protein